MTTPLAIVVVATRQQYCELHQREHAVASFACPSCGTAHLDGRWWQHREHTQHHCRHCPAKFETSEACIGVKEKTND